MQAHVVINKGKHMEYCANPTGFVPLLPGICGLNFCGLLSSVQVQKGNHYLDFSSVTKKNGKQNFSISQHAIWLRNFHLNFLE